MRLSRVLILLVVAVLTAGCAAAGITAGQLAAIVSSFMDPAGDDTPDAGGTGYDILRIVSTRIDNSPFGTYDTLRTEITFDTAPVLPPAGTFPDEGTELGFRVYFDTNQDPATGLLLNGMCGTTGIEYWVDAVSAAEGGSARLANGNYQVNDDALTATGEATVSVAGNTLTVNVPLSALGNDNGATNMSVRVANGLDSTVDCGPHTGGAIITREGASPDKRK